MKQLTYWAFALFIVGLIACNGRNSQNTADQPDATALQDSLRPAGLEEGSNLTKDVPALQNRATERKGKVQQPTEEKPKTLKERVKSADSKKEKSGGGEEAPIAENNTSTTVTEKEETPRAIQVSEKTSTEENKISENITETSEETTETIEVNEGISHATWDELLKKYVTASGKVNYQGFKSAESKLDTYLETLKSNPPQSSWSRNEKLAYWINVYNAFTVKLIVKNYPVQSITDLHGGKPWDVKWIDIGGKTYTLNNIEHDIIRPRFNEPRIHFAVNCAAKSCPPLLNAAYTADKLNNQLEQQTKKFINNSSFNTISASKVEISKIFDWYKEDFSNLIAFLNKYATTKINSSATVNYKEYNWALNN